MRTAREKITFTAVWSKLLELLVKYPVLVVPFLLMAVFDILLLIFIFLAPNYPFSIVLAPLIRAFWGEQYLHYPTNFLLLPTLFNYARIPVSFITGLTFAGVGAAMVFQASQDTKPSWFFGIGKVARRYIRLAVVWGVSLAGVIVLIRFLQHMNGLFGYARLSIAAEFSVGLMVQLLLVFALPSIIIENKKILASLVRSLALVRHYPFMTFFIVLIPSLFIIPFLFVGGKLPYLMEQVAPEAVLYLLIIRVLAMTFVDFVILSSAAVLLVMHRTIIENREPDV